MDIYKLSVTYSWSLLVESNRSRISCGLPMMMDISTPTNKEEDLHREAKINGPPLENDDRVEFFNS